MTVFIKPVNRTLLVEREPVVEKKNDLGIILPESTKPTTISSGTIVKLIASESDSLYSKYEGQNLLVRSSMLEDIETKGAKGTFISETGVIAIISYSGLL